MSARRLFRGHALGAVFVVALLGAGLPLVVPHIGAASGDPVAFRPVRGRSGVPIEIPRGKELLYLFLQRLADYTGLPAYFLGETAPNQTITIARDVEKLDFDTARDLLRSSGFQLTRQTYRQQEVLWVEKLLAPTGQRGQLIRRRPGQEEPLDSAAAETASTPTGAALFERRDGAGSRFLVTFETSSREEANDVILLIEAFQKKQIGQ